MENLIFKKLPEGVIMKIQERLLNTSDVAELLNLSVRQVTYLVDKGEIAPIKQFNKYNIFDKEQILNYKTQKGL